MPPLEEPREDFDYKGFRDRRTHLMLRTLPYKPHRKTKIHEYKLIEMKNNNVIPNEELERQPCSGINVVRTIGPITEKQPIFVDQSMGNHYRGIRKRVVHKQIFKQHIMDEFRDFCYHYIKRHYQPLPYIESNIELVEEWLKGSKYTIKQKEKLKSEYLRFMDGRMSDNEFYRINSFIKKEFYCDYKEPRTINAPSTAMKAVLGPYIHKIEKIVFDKHFIKGLTPSEVAERLREVSAGYGLIYETDYSSFEGTFSRDVMDCCELTLFRVLLANNKRILNYIINADLSERDVYYRNGAARVRFYGSRLSGALWTSLGNGFTNKMLVEFVAHKTRRRAFHYDYLVEGDDGFVASSLKLNWAAVGDVGFRLKCEEAHEINDVSFCGICLGPQGLTPDINRTLMHFGYTYDDYLVRASNPNSKRYVKREKQMIRAKAMSLLATSRGCPILQPMALKLIELTNGVTIRKKDFDWWEINVLDILRESMKPINISEETYKFVERRFKISRHVIDNIEKEISKIKDYHVVLPLWL